jgi:hypothetical protein
LSGKIPDPVLTEGNNEDLVLCLSGFSIPFSKIEM